MRRVIAAVTLIAIMLTAVNAVTVYADGNRLLDQLNAIIADQERRIVEDLNQKNKPVEDALKASEAAATWDEANYKLKQRADTIGTKGMSDASYHLVFDNPDVFPLNSVTIDVPLNAASGDYWWITKSNPTDEKVSLLVIKFGPKGQRNILNGTDHMLTDLSDRVILTISYRDDTCIIGSIDAVYNNSANHFKCSFNALIKEQSSGNGKNSPSTDSSSSGSSFGSSTKKPTWHWEEKKVDCPSCINGKCSICNGTGTYRLHGQTVFCKTKCTSCSGRGYIMQKVYVYS